MTKRLWAIRLSLIIFVACIVGTESSLGAAPKSESETIQRQYAPDRKVDVLHITIDITPDFGPRTIAGTTTIKFAPVAEPLTELELDAVELDVSSVTSSARTEAYSVTDEAITITFEPAVEVGEETTVKIVYEAEPRRGLYFRTPEMGYRPEDTHLFTQGETHEAPHWYPNFDYPNERFSSEVICHVPEAMTVLSNGRLVSEETDQQTGLKAVRWLQDKPHVNYLVALVAGRLKKIESKYRDIPIAFYTPASQIQYAENSFKDTADMLEFFEEEIGAPYPWDKYYQVVVDDFVAGGMENTSLTILADRTLFTSETENIRSSQSLVAHELAHQWFGDYVTCKDWSHIWLNEGFATYYEDLYDGYKNGRDSLLANLYGSAKYVLSERPEYKPIVHRSYDDADEQFDYRTYSKGGWVLHMLRMELGEELYRRCVKTYLERHALSSVVTEDFRSVIEELTGKSFDQFFDQWIYHGRHPDLTVSYSWSQKDKLAKVSVKQTHEVSEDVMLFHFRTKVRFVIDDEAIDREIVVDSAQHDFYFALPKEPTIVRFDPGYGLLAKVKFEKPTAMLYAQLENRDDVIGRLRAIDELKEKKDKKTIAKLKDALDNDPFYGVRKAASSALCDIHTDEAFDALAESIDQPDARVRQQVVEDIGGFYKPESLGLMRQVLKNEKNPEILAEAIRYLGRYRDKDTRRLLIRYLKSESYRNRLGGAAVNAIHMLDDASYIGPLQKVLRQREQEFTSGGFASALNTLAHISRDEEDKTEARNFLAAYVNHPKRRIQAGAIRALGTLGDPKAIPLVETFSGDDPRDWVERSAERALEALREKKKFVPEEIIRLRDTIDELKGETEKLKDELEDIKKRLDAKEDVKNQEDAEAPESEQPATSDESDQQEE